MIAIELVSDREKKTPAADIAKKIVGEVFKKKLLLLACGNYGNVLRILVPLTVDETTLENGLAILEEVLADNCK